MKKILFAFVLLVSQATFAQPYDLDAECAYTVRNSGDSISYRELLEEAKENTSGNPMQRKYWVGVDNAIRLFSKPVKKPGKYENDEYDDLLAAERALKGIFAEKFKHGMPGLKANEEGRHLARKKFNTYLHDLDYALTILHVNAYKATGGNN